MTTILITGCAGFIGSFLARALLRDGHDIIGIDNFEKYYSRKAKEFNLDLIRKSCNQKLEKFESDEIAKVLNMLDRNKNPQGQHCGKFNFIECDIRDKVLLEKVFNETRPEKVVHLAAMAGVPFSIKEPAYYTDVNATGTVNMLELAAKYSTKQFIFGSSSSVYGERTDFPFKENDDVTKPISPYAASKVMGEVICYTYSQLYKLPITIIRIFGPVYGPLQRPYGMAAQRFIRQIDHGKPITIFGDGSMARDCTYIEDMVNGLVLALKKDFRYEIINIGRSKPIMVRDAAKSIVALFGKGKIIHVDKPTTEAPITFADISKANELFGYKPCWDFIKGIKEQFDVYMLMPQWYKDLPE